MNKSNSINVLATIPTSVKKNKNNNRELKVLPLNVNKFCIYTLDKNIQCNLLQAPLYLELRGFSIEDPVKRKCLLRAIFGWIILQNFVYLPVMFIFLRNVPIISLNVPIISLNVSTIMWIINFIISALLYRFRNFRRPLANAYLSFIFVTILCAILMGIFANSMNSLTVLFQPIILIVQLFAIILYSLQSKFKLTNFRAFIIVLIVYLAFILANLFIFHYSTFYSTSTLSFTISIYIIFDTQLMLTSPLHNYQLAANEHVFGAVNLFADQSKLGWLLFRCFFLDSTISFCRNAFKTMTSKLY